jgi:phosphoglycerate kinase
MTAAHSSQIPRKRTLAQLTDGDLEGKTVLVRADLNVPLSDAGEVTDDTRIRATVPTLRKLVEAGARVVLFSHLGRPKGGPDPRYSIRPVLPVLSELARAPVAFCDVPAGDAVARKVKAVRTGEILLLENTRFLAGDEGNDPALAKSWAELADIFVNDAFGAAHRAHASTAGVALAVRERGGLAVSGLLMERELKFLSEALEEPERPFVAILGGAKISGKIDVIQALLPRADRLLVGGAMANTFFRALGLEVGASLIEEDRVVLARDTLEQAGDKLMLPVDCVVAPELKEGAVTRDAPRDGVVPGERIGDIGPASREVFAREIARARTVVWNGPMGVFETKPFDAGTVAMAHAVATATDRGALTVVGGGDSVSAVEAAGVAERITHISTGGGASLELLAGEELPGVTALSDAQGGAVR